MPTKKSPSPDVISSLRSVVPGIFDTAQRSGTGHRKHAVSLYKLQTQCHDADTEELTGEDAFNKEFIRNLNKILGIKKREASAEKIVKLVATFVQVSYEKDMQALAKSKLTNGSDADDVFSAEQDEEVDTASSRFVELLIRYLLQGFQAKEKLTRLRCCQIVAMSVTSLGEIDEELYFELVKRLSERIRDKEAAIRVHAAIALSKLQSGEDGDGGEVTEALLGLMQNDPSAEVRRAVLLNIAKSPKTLPYVLERARDVDATNRKCLFLKVMPPIDYRLLSIEDRERLLAAGVNDRDAAVKRACVRMIGESWLTFANQNLLELTSSLDVVDSPAANKVLQALFAAYPEIPENLQFDQELWESLTPEMAFIIRSTLEFFCERKDADGIDKHLPEAMQLARLLESFGAKLEAEQDDELRPDIEFVIHQLLLIAKISDFPDEMGRREMLTLMRKMILVPEIPENNIEAIADIIRKLSINEQDFIRIMVEVVSDVRELAPVVDSTSPEDIRLEALLVSIKSLIIIKYILQRCFDPLSEGSSIYGLLTECVVPAVQSSETVLQEYGIECLALCCLLDKSLAVDNVVLFAQAVKQGSGDLRSKGLAALLDIAFMYGIADLAVALGEPADFVSLLNAELENEDERIQAMAGEGIAKLLYAHRIPEPARVLEELLVLYYHPATSSNDALRQCLTYFFPAFSYMSPDNQAVMQEVTVSAVCRLAGVLKQQSTESGATHGQAAQQMATWSDPRILDAIAAINNSTGIRISARMSGYANIAVEALKRIFSEPPATRKVLVQMLNKLALDDNTPYIQLQQMFVLTRTLAQQQLFSDMISRNALVRFETLLLKLLEVESPEEINLESWLEEPQMVSVFEFISSLDAEDGSEDSATDDEDTSIPQSPASASGSEQETSEKLSNGNGLGGVNVSSAIPVAANTSIRNPLKRGREKHIEELTREIDELLESDDEDDAEEYMSAED
ncbi:chromosome condensation complex Condensin, subunit G [Coemansia sp. RSA 989]|nr:chromosome condensation complex Condensin, subunit G [Coemansia sp. RSA 1086]KAJ1752980.1 chromosome condensation complex Condensin, subunit G [Coemansia sp. RSA 1821]KAJ1866682.1 chromosome condensation complex Condensin, subunit G [Coemansia sp. RSA 989]KAJ1875495.1 chromosome condensation complex Condensin, subunit G [Coemansia sp. RSA 990]KAJ2651932.1 chromosome condensation complex Condensin, subunit G [Coemansia sp. RSA 1250]KAJ2674959.1 chromosome condensation complex Condensin, subu